MCLSSLFLSAVYKVIVFLSLFVHIIHFVGSHIFTENRILFFIPLIFHLFSGMNVKNRIINNAVQHFIETPVAAPSYYDLNADDDLTQYKDDETKEVFGMTIVLVLLFRRNTCSLSLGRLCWNP